MQLFRTIIFLTTTLGLSIQSTGQELELVIPRGHTNPVTHLTVSSDKKFINSTDGTNEIIIWSVLTQKEVVRQELTNPVTAMNSGNQTTFLGLGDGKLFRINYENLELEQVWQGPAAINAISYNADDVILGLKSGEIFRLSQNGKVLDSINLNQEITSIQIKNNLMWVASSTGEVLRIELNKSQKPVRFTVSQAHLNNLLIHNNRVFATDDRGYLHALDLDGKLLNSVQVFGLRARQLIAESDSTLLLVGRDDFANFRRVNFRNWQVSSPGLWQEEFTFNDFPLGLYAIKKFSDTQYLISGYQRNFLLVDSLTNAVSFTGEASVINQIDIDASGTRLAIATNKNEIQVIDLTGARNPKYHITTSAPTSLQWVDNQLYAGLASGAYAVVTKDSITEITPGIKAEYATTNIIVDTSRQRLLRKYTQADLTLLELNTGSPAGTIKKARFAYEFMDNEDAFLFVDAKGKLIKIEAENLKKKLTYPINDVRDFKLIEDQTQLVARSGNTYFYLATATGKLLKTVSISDVGDNFYLTPDGSRIFLAQASRAKGSTETNYRVSVYDDSGSFLFNLEGHSAQIRDIEFIKSGQFILTASADGVIKIWDRQGKLLANLVPLAQGQHTVVATTGQFDATLLAMDKLSYRQGKESIKLEQVKDKYYEPGILAKILGFKAEPITATDTLQHVKLYPEFNLTHPMQNNGILGINVKPREGGTGRIVILINGKEAPHNIDVSAEGHAEFNVMTHPYILTGDLNKISVKIYNEDGDAVSSPKNLFYLDKQKPEDIKAHLYGLVIGVSDYHGDHLDLKYAAKDATDIAKAIEASGKTYLGEDYVHVKRMTTLNDSSSILWPSKKNILAQFDSIAAKASPRDILFLYLSGHGEVDEDSTQEFYYLTADAGSGNIFSPELRNSTLISNHELIKELQTMPTLKQVMIVDACHSGSLVSSFEGKSKTMSSTQVKSLETLKDRANIYVLAGSAEDAVSYESSIYGQGLLTYSLLMGMKGPALRNNQFVDILQLFNFASSEVPELANEIGGIQKPEIRIPSGGSFDIGQFNEETKKNINLNSPKPIFIHSIFQHEEEYVDVLDLGRIVDSELRAIDNTSDAKIVFLNTNEYHDAFVIQGRYTINKGEGLSIQVKLFKDKSLIKSFDVAAANAGEAKKVIIKTILEAVEPLL